MKYQRAIQTAGADLRVGQSGESPQAIFLHGFGADLHTWDSVWLSLGGALPALRYDLRGFGQSTARQPCEFSHSEDLLQLMDAAGVASADLIGVSMGAGIAINFALTYPTRVRKLVLISPALVAWEWSPNWLTLWRPIVDLARAGALNEARQKWWEHPLFATTRSSAGGAALYESIMRFPGRQWIQDNQRPALPDVDRIHRLKQPTLLLAGGRDMADFSLIADLLEASVGNLRRIDHAGLGHLLHLESPAGCAHSILSFLRQDGDS